MLAYSGKGRFVVEPIDLGALVRETARLLEVSIGKNAHLQYELDGAACRRSTPTRRSCARWS